ncbi:MAG: transcriptional regulator NanR [Bryobacteraceae bacterium]|nr:transcriptional regulator NanR [Bryobacteraceae bacterium]
MSQSPPEEKIARRKLGDEVLDRLLQMIERGEIEPGGYLPSERALMARFGVGRPAVREALQALAGMGIIRIQHGERARRASLGPQTVLEQVDRSVKLLLQTSPAMREHLREARLAFEAGMARLAARKAGPADLANLREALARQAAARGDAARFVAADLAFHRAIAAVAGNPIFAAVSHALLEWVFEVYPRLLRVPGVEDLTFREHQAILDAIAARDEDRAVAALTAHLLRSNPLYAAAVPARKRRPPGKGA